jgi:hypothetical protein
VKYELRRMWDEAVVAGFKEIAWYSLFIFRKQEQKLIISNVFIDLLLKILPHGNI